VRGTLGIATQNLTSGLASHFGVPSGKGVLVSEVNPGSPAARAGLERGDVIVSFAGHAADNDSGELRNLVAGTPPGSAVVLEIVRDGKPMTLTVTIAEQSAPVAAEQAPEAEASRPEQFGLSVFALTPAIAHRFGIDHARGVIILNVDAAGLGASAGLEPGDVILEVDRTPVASVGALVHALERAKQRNALLLIARQHGTIYVALRW
jgi:serine protease Do